MTNRDWLTSLTDHELANELLNFAGLHKKLMFDTFNSFDAVSKWLGEERTTETAESYGEGAIQSYDEGIVQNRQGDSQWSKELTRCSWYPGKYNGGGWPPR